MIKNWTQKNMKESDKRKSYISSKLHMISLSLSVSLSLSPSLYIYYNNLEEGHILLPLFLGVFATDGYWFNFIDWEFRLCDARNFDRKFDYAYWKTLAISGSVCCGPFILWHHNCFALREEFRLGDRLVSFCPCVFLSPLMSDANVTRQNCLLVLQMPFFF